MNSIWFYLTMFLLIIVIVYIQILKYVFLTNLVRICFARF